MTAQQQLKELETELRALGYVPTGAESIERTPEEARAIITEASAHLEGVWLQALMQLSSALVMLQGGAST
jgi:hypothetical protein